MTKQKIATRKPLSSARVLQAAVALADEAGLEAFSMRGLAQELGVVPMALYKHVANKEELLDGMVDIVFSEIELPSGDLDWRSAMRRRAISTREALKRHSWAIGMMESRHPGPANLRNHNAVMGCLREGGLLIQDGDPRLFSSGRLHLRLRPAGTGHGVRDARQRRRSRAEEGARRSARSRTTRTSSRSPRSSPSPGTTTRVEFAWGLDLILDGLDRLRHAGAAPA